MKWIRVDIDGTGKRWRLAVERDDALYFPVEDFEDLAANYEDCEQAPVLMPDTCK